MPLARWKDLCIDATDPDRMGVFWAGALGLRRMVLDDGDLRLDGESPEHAVWVNAVPEPQAVKQRVHLDIYAASVADVEALGAHRLSADGEFAWTVLADPEGGELCVFVRDDVPDYRLYEIGVDTAQPAAVARWWSDVLGARLADDEGGFSYIDDIPGAPFDSIDFAPVPEPKTVKNRIHWDVNADAVQPLVDAGAAVLRAPDDEIFWHVLADPEGNEFCCFTE